MTCLLTACLIVKNEAKVLQETLPELIAAADEVVVVDTGSTDETRTLATSLGAKVHVFPWIDDFSKARNFSLAQATGKWILWIDADEFIPREQLIAIRPVLEETREDGFLVRLHECLWGEKVTGETTRIFYRRVKLFRNHIGIHFRRPINEQLFTKEGKMFSSTAELPITISHWGGSHALPPHIFREKKEKRAALYRRYLAEHPDDAEIHYLLGETCLGLDQFETAISHYHHALLVGRFLPDLYAHILVRKAYALFRLEKMEEAIHVAGEARRCYPENAESLCLVGKVYLKEKKFDEAIAAFHEALTTPIPKPDAAPVSLAAYQEQPHYYLGYTYLLMKCPHEAIPHFQEAYRLNPDPKTKRLLEKAAMLQQMLDQLKELGYVPRATA